VSTEVLPRLQASLAEVASTTRDVVRVAPFTAYLDPVRELKYLSFALPDPGTGGGEAAGALDELRAEFTVRGRSPRVEYLQALAPGMGEALEAAGWTLSEALPVMTCTPATLAAPAPPDGLELSAVTAAHDDATIRAYLETIRAGFDDDEPVTRAQLEQFRARGDWTRMAGRMDGGIVCTAQCTPPALGVVEVAAVVTLPAFRRRGLAGAVTAAVCRRAFAAGAEIAWLTAADDGAERIYARAGFAVAGRQLAYDAPD